jgi:DNA repair protein RadC
MAITDWPLDERPREKLLARGPQALSDAELLAILLRTGSRRGTALDLARDLLHEHGGLRGLLAASPQSLLSTHGLGQAKYAQIAAVLEISRRHLGESLQRGAAMGSPQSVRDYLRVRLRDMPHEVFCCLYLDNRHRVLAFEELFRGTVNGAAVYPREVVKRALHHNAAATILVHNHPSGVAEPSRADELLTIRLKEALGMIEVRVLDHLVVGEGDCVSFAERGLL